MQTTTIQTPYEQAKQAVKEGRIKTPSVNGGTINYFKFQFASHHFYMKLFAKGMKSNQINLKRLKEYYGLKGRSAKDCLPEFEKLMNDYNTELINSN